MKTNKKEFLIPFVGLKIGKHFFDFEINSSFFDAFEYSPIQNGVLNAKLELDKKETMLVANYIVEGEIETLCDRCNTEMQLPISGAFRLIYKFGNEEEEDESLIVLLPDVYEIDASTAIYELITSLLPLRATHKKGACDEEMWKLIQTHTVNANDDPEDEEDLDWDDEDWDDEYDDDESEEDESEDDGSDFPLLNNLN